MRCGAATLNSGVMSPRLLRAYRQTNYHAAGMSVRIGRKVPEALFERIDARVAVIVTAWNPRSRRMPQGWNHRMQRRLREHLRRHVGMYAEGSLAGWHEAMLLVAADPRLVIRVAVRFRQHGVVVLRRGHKPQLVFVMAKQARKALPR